MVKISIMSVLISTFLTIQACGTEQQFQCCADNVIKTCTCPANSLCARRAFTDHGDGTCSDNTSLNALDAGVTHDTSQVSDTSN